MDPITTALVAGAAVALKDVASDAIKAAYKGLRDLLGNKLSSLANLEEDPADEDYRKAASEELQKKGLADDPTVQEKAKALTEALELEPPERLAAAGIDIGQIRAAGAILVKDLEAPGGVLVKDLEATGGNVQVQGVSAGGSRRNEAGDLGPGSFVVQHLQAGGDIIVGDVRAIMQRIEDLSGRLAVTRSEVSTFLRMLSEAEVPEGEEGIKLIEIATHYKMLEKQIELLKASDPQVQSIRAEVEFALTQGNFDLAETLLASALSQIKAIEQLRSGQVEEALKLLREAGALLEPIIEKNPNYARLILQIGYILKTQADALRRSKDSAQAETLLTEALECFQRVAYEIPASQKTVSDLASAMNGIANIAYIRGDASSAATCGETATALDPSYAYAWHDLLGVYLVLARKGDVRVERMRKALERLRATCTGLPGLDATYLASLEQHVQAFMPAK